MLSFAPLAANSAAYSPELSHGRHGQPQPDLLTQRWHLPCVGHQRPQSHPAMLERKFKLPVDKMDFPPVERRIELSQRDQDHNDVPVALLARGGPESLL